MEKTIEQQIADLEKEVSQLKQLANLQKEIKNLKKELGADEPNKPCGCGCHYNFYPWYQVWYSGNRELWPLQPPYKITCGDTTIPWGSGTSISTITTGLQSVQ